MMAKTLIFVHELPILIRISSSVEMCICFAAYSSLLRLYNYCVDHEKCVFRLAFSGVHEQFVLPQMMNFHDMKRGLSDSNQHGNNGVDRPVRLSRAQSNSTRQLIPIQWEILSTNSWNSHGNKNGRSFC